MIDTIIKSDQAAELQELLNSFARSGERLTEAYTVLLEQHGALVMITGALVGCFRAYDPNFAPRMIAGLEKIVALQGDDLTDGQREYLEEFIAIVVVGTGEAVAKH
jgi:hypothetical protein